MDFSALFSDPRLAVAAGAGVVGLLFGALSESSQFCLLGGLRETRDGRGTSRLAAYGVAVLAALAFTQALVGAGAVDVTGSVYLSTATALPGLIVGGLLFGFGAALTRGCAGRLTVLAATGNLRALVVMVVVGLAAYATMRGVFAPARLPLEAIAKPDAARADLVTGLGLAEGARYAVAALAAVAAVALARFAGPWRALASILIGGAIAGGWAVSSILGDDGFEKLQPWSGAFVAPVANGLQYLMTFTGAKIDFGVAFVGGVLVGAFASAFLGGRAQLVSFESPRQTLRYLAGGAMMGFGGVLALGCSTGQGLSGVSTLAPSSFVALAAIAGGMWAGLVWDRAGARRAATAGVAATA
jgi:uncharacterized membrane protein YedE/YeeE